MEKFIEEYISGYDDNEAGFHSLWLMPNIGDNTPRFLEVSAVLYDSYDFLPFRLPQHDGSDEFYFHVAITPNEFMALLDGRMEALPTFDVFHMTLLKTGPAYKPQEPIALHYNI